MNAPREEDVGLLLVVGGVGGYVVAASGDRLVIQHGRAVVCSRLVDGLAASLGHNNGQVRLRLARTPDGDEILMLAALEGFGWAENLSDASYSEWGYCG